MANLDHAVAALAVEAPKKDKKDKDKKDKTGDKKEKKEKKGDGDEKQDENKEHNGEEVLPIYLDAIKSKKREPLTYKAKSHSDEAADNGFNIIGKNLWFKKRA